MRRQPWEYRGEGALRDVMTLALSFDHRLVDGEQGSKFLVEVADVLRAWNKDAGVRAIILTILGLLALLLLVSQIPEPAWRWSEEAQARKEVSEFLRDDAAIRQAWQKIWSTQLLINERDQLRLAHGAHFGRCQLAIFEKHQGWDTPNSKFGRNVTIFIHVHFGDLHFAFVVHRHIIQNRGNHFAGTTPFCPVAVSYTHLTLPTSDLV